MAKGLNRLDATTVKGIVSGTAKGKLAPKVYGDGGGLYFQVTEYGASWLFRFTFAGVRRNTGLGDVQSVSLATARRIAAEQRALVADGIDPVKKRDAAQRALRAATTMSFKPVCERFLAERSPEWHSTKTTSHFDRLMSAHAYPVIGKMGVNDIGMDDALRVLKPIWLTQNASARRLMFWCRLAIDATRGEPGGIDPDRRNPFEWKGCLALRLARPSKIARTKPHASIDYRSLPGFTATLRATDGIPARMAELCVLTTVRTRPILDMKWREVDFQAAVWNIPADNEKTFEDHRVPLSDRALEILAQHCPANARPDDRVWPGRNGRRSHMTLLRVLYRLGFAPKEITQHGFRRTFANWRAELTDFNADMQEIALSHAIPGVRGVYQTGRMLERRRSMMEAWSDYCDGATNIVPFKGKAA
jgi:integrase